MFRLLDLFKKPQPKPLLQKDQRIKVTKPERAKLVVTSDEVLVFTDMRLIHIGEDENRVFFRVRSNFYPTDSITHAKDEDQIYFYKDEFFKLEYKKCRNH